MMIQRITRAMTTILALMVFVGCAAIAASTTETPGERFDKAMKRLAEQCAKLNLPPNRTDCDPLKLRPADPLATPEGRFAHSIKIPNPVPEDSGYKPGMTPEQYFDHLCKTEAGEFIYRTVENVEGLYMMRPRGVVSFGGNHLYAYEDPYGHWNEEATEPEILFVKPSRYGFLETPLLIRKIPDSKKKQLHQSMLAAPDTNARYERYFGYDGKDRRTMQKVYDAALKSQYGYTWRGITRPHDRELGIAGSELIIIDLQTQEVLSVFRGYAKFEIDENAGLMGAYWARGCPVPARSGIGPQREFILKVLKPTRSLIN